jgi:hypothetical protein
MNEYANTVIDALGGTTKVAELCDLTTGAVSQWRTNGIPKTTLKFLRLSRPKVFSVIDKETREAA